MPTPNPFQDRARDRKASAMAALLWGAANHDGAPASDLPERVAHLPAPVRDAVAKAAEQNPPSEETWEVVVERVRALMVARQTVRRARA